MLNLLWNFGCFPFSIVLFYIFLGTCPIVKLVFAQEPSVTV